MKLRLITAIVGTALVTGAPSPTRAALPITPAGITDHGGGWGIAPVETSFHPGAFAAKEEGGGITDHGGGGTFIRRGGADRLLLWDLYLLDPRVRDQGAGDTIRLTPAGKAAGGEWIDYRKLRSFAYLGERLRRWKKRAPNLVGFLLQAQERDLRVIATELRIEQISEIAVPHWTPALTAGLVALPGAYYDYPTKYIYIDVNVWNQAGIVSQAAALLHERLRELQLHFAFSNDELQQTVGEIMLRDPDQARNDYSNSDYEFGPEFYKNGPRLQNAKGAAPGIRPSPAPDEITYAKEKGILGTARKTGPVRADGAHNKFSEKVGWMLLEPLQCESDLSAVLAKSPHDQTLHCDEGYVMGHGRMHFEGDPGAERTWDLGVRFLRDDEPIKIEIFKKTRESAGVPATFVRHDGRVRVRIGEINPTEVEIPLADPDAFYTYEVHLAGNLQRVYLYFGPYDDGLPQHGASAASWELPPELAGPKGELLPYPYQIWDLEMGDGVVLRSLRTGRI